MFCSSCGVALAQPMKYCNRCGSHVIASDTEVIQIIEKRMDSEMEGLFWITVFSLGFVLGGIIVLNKLHLSQAIIVAYLIFCALGFLSYFSLGIWQIRRMSRIKQSESGNMLSSSNTNELPQLEARPPLATVASVTEHTTRTLEPVTKN
ncbi:MAG TPA: hypothetical protein VN643_16935 [Pyrinomonadaceae bacterium]|nr:hypothetical protein [Pyrinomonadaceae bacterium]